jgi:SAM-dependent methyltransferase
VGSIIWGPEVAATYDDSTSGPFDPTVINETVDVLAALAQGGSALEFAVGTGRIALPLSRRGVRVAGIELSPHMAAQLAKKPGAEAIEVVLGDMCTASVPGSFRLVYVIYNAITIVTTQDEQVAVFANAARHLEPGGIFLVEVVITRPTPGSGIGQVFYHVKDHLAFDTFDDPVGQVACSHHWRVIDGQVVRTSTPFRYLWPSEMDLMARLAGLTLRERWADWDRTSFGPESTKQIAVYELTG